MKRRLSLNWLCLLALCALPTASAHDLARDGAVGGLLHLQPDDEPVAGQPSALFVDLRALGGGAVTLAQCGCTLKVTGAEGSQSVPLKDASGHLNASLTFPKPGPYTLILTGTLNARPFTLRWVVRAEGR